MTNEVGDLGGQVQERTIETLQMSCQTQDNVDSVRQRACDLLLSQRVEKKVTQARSEGIKNRIHISQPTVIRNLSSAGAIGGAAKTADKNASVSQKITQQRPATIPQSVLQMREAMDNGEKREDLLKSMMPEDWKNEKELQEEMGGAGVYTQDKQAKFMLADEEWKYDNMPEFMDGHNIADFVDTEILSKLAELEKEEETELAAEGLLDTEEVLAQWKETEGELAEVHGAIKYKQMEKRCKSTNNTAGHGGTEKRRTKKISEITEELRGRGFEPNEESLRGRSKNRKRNRGISIFPKLILIQFANKNESNLPTKMNPICQQK